MGAVKNDLCGVVLAVIALTMFISLISTTEAPVTYAIGQVLTLGFGAGAMLVPLTFLLAWKVNDLLPLLYICLYQ